VGLTRAKQMGAEPPEDGTPIPPRLAA
jgi:hypothetical protein